MLLLVGPFSVLVSGELDLDTHWSEASMASSGQSPLPDEESAALVQVFGARAFNWRGAFGIHTWIAAKRSRAKEYTVYQVVGWNLYRNRSVVSITRGTTPDFYWYNAYPDLLLQRRGEGTDALIDRIDKAARAYPYTRRYRVWPGPNSNSFVAFIARQVPELGLDLPPTAIGKDYLTHGELVGRMPSGTGWQVSLLGLLGAGVAREEGIEVNLLGLSVGVDINDRALRLPGLGRLSLTTRD